MYSTQVHDSVQVAIAASVKIQDTIQSDTDNHHVQCPCPGQFCAEIALTQNICDESMSCSFYVPFGECMKPNGTVYLKVSAQFLGNYFFILTRPNLCFLRRNIRDLVPSTSRMVMATCSPGWAISFARQAFVLFISPMVLSMLSSHGDTGEIKAWHIN